jgi:hypothetical protein
MTSERPEAFGPCQPEFRTGTFGHSHTSSTSFHGNCVDVHWTWSKSSFMNHDHLNATHTSSLLLWRDSPVIRSHQLDRIPVRTRAACRPLALPGRKKTIHAGPHKDNDAVHHSKPSKTSASFPGRYIHFAMKQIALSDPSHKTGRNGSILPYGSVQS